MSAGYFSVKQVFPGANDQNADRISHDPERGHAALRCQQSTNRPDREQPEDMEVNQALILDHISG